MIVAEQKPFQELVEKLADYKNVLILGCGTCVTVCMSGGEKEVGILAEQIRLYERETPEEKRHKIHEATIERQCDVEFFEPVRDAIMEADCILSLACGVGVQHLSEHFAGKTVLPGLDTKYFGTTVEPGEWAERCAGCGSCIVDLTAGICPVARCSKSMLNGPCGGSQDGKCEISDDVECAWQLIYDRLADRGELGKLTEMMEIKDWTPARDGGPRRTTREDAKT